MTFLRSTGAIGRDAWHVAMAPILTTPEKRWLGREPKAWQQLVGAVAETLPEIVLLPVADCMVNHSRDDFLRARVTEVAEPTPFADERDQPAAPTLTLPNFLRQSCS
jgi:hypothetical protein